MVINPADYDVEQDKLGLYLLHLNDEAAVYPDLTTPGPHLINHSCDPNCWIYIYQGHTLVFAIKPIASGEEITISYLLSSKDGCDPCTHDCVCGEVICTGTMHLSNEKFALWQQFQNKRKDSYDLQVTFGSQLPHLSIYPAVLPVDPIYSEIVKSSP